MPRIGAVGRWLTFSVLWLWCVAAVWGGGDSPSPQNPAPWPVERVVHGFPVPRVGKPAADRKKLRYREADIPYYKPGAGRRGDARWGQMQLPLPPEESVKHMVLPPGFRAELVAAEPQVAKPMCLAWDEQGRLWIGESVDYPNRPHPLGQGNDRIKVCEDTDGDGRMDRFTVFATGLSIPASIAFCSRGVIVHQWGKTVLLEDTDGDLRADRTTVLLDGWGTFDTHATASNLRYGLDNWYWGTVGYSGFKGTVGNQRHEFRMGIYRFRVGSGKATAGEKGGVELEFLRSTNNNTWGLGMSETGQWFVSTANGNPSGCLVIPNRYFESVRGLSVGPLPPIADSWRFRAVTDRIRQVDFHGGYTAASGHALYTARRWPQVFWDRTAFVCEPTGHLVGTFVLWRQGTQFHATNPFNILASQDEWTAPIVAEVGPDGHLWVIDWYNYIVQHNPTPLGFKTGRGNAYETPLRDKRHGRIWRIVWTQADAAPRRNLHGASPARLVATLEDPNLLWRLHAQRLLVQGKATSAVPQLLRLVQRRRIDPLGYDVAALHALWTLHGLGVVNESHPQVLQAAQHALEHPAWPVRRAAVEVLPAGSGTARALLAKRMLADAEPLVRLAALLKLSRCPRSPEVAAALWQFLQQEENLRDRHLRQGAVILGAQNAAELLALALEDSREWNASLREVLVPVVVHLARTAPAAAVPRLVAALEKAHRANALLVAQELARNWPPESQVRLSPEAQRRLVNLFRRGTGPLRHALAGLAARWSVPELKRQVRTIVAELLRQFADPDLDEAKRLAALRAAVELAPGEPTVAEKALAELGPSTPLPWHHQVLQALEKARTEAVAAELLRRMDNWTPAQQQAALKLLLGRTQWARLFLEHARRDARLVRLLSLPQRQMLLGHPQPEIKRLARLVLSARGASSEDRRRVVEQWAEVARLPGNPDRGRQVFEKHCAKCHMFRGRGASVGPDLTGMAVHPKEELLVHILDPSRSVEGNFRLYTVLLADGRVLQGMLRGETRTALQLVDQQGKQHDLAREDIEQLAASDKSLMPEGFEKQLTRQQMADLLAYLTRPGRFVPLPLAKAATAVSTAGMFYSRQAPQERLIFQDWGPKHFQGVPFYLIDPQGDRVPNVVLLYSPLGTFPPQMPKRVEIPCNLPLVALHMLGGVAGWGHPLGQKGSVSLIVRFHYADGTHEDHPLRNGIHVADYIRRVDVPGSKFAFALRGQQIRYLAIRPKRPGQMVKRIELLKGPDQTAPVVMALTAETPQPEAER